MLQKEADTPLSLRPRAGVGRRLAEDTADPRATDGLSQLGRELEERAAEIGRAAGEGASLTRTAVEVLEVQDRRATTAFIRVAHDLNKDDPSWIAPLWLERRKALDRGRNPYFKHAEAAFWIAYRDGRPVGRISAQVDRLWLERHKSATGHFGMFDAIDDFEVATALLETAETWLQARGMVCAIGPLSLSINQETGLLVEGFESPPMIMMGHSKPHLKALLERAGYRKAIDVFAYRFELGTSTPAAQSILRRVKRDQRVTVRPLRWADYDRDVAAALEIFNDAWAGNWGFVPLTPDEMADTAREMRPLLSERLVWFAEVGGEPAAMIIALPNLNEAIHDLEGRLAAFGWAKLLWRLKVRGVRSARIPLMGVRRKYASSLLGTILPFRLIEALQKEGQSLGLRKVELSWILEANRPMRKIIEAFGAERYKTYRVFEKPLEAVT
jgi:hypothetical protein